MQDLNDKITGNTLTAAEWNEVPSEIQNVIEGLGITLSGADLNQLGKGIAGYVANGAFYTDSGVANAYVLSPIGSKQAPPEYTEDFTAIFIATNTNTAASTVNVAGLGVKNIEGTSGGEIVAGVRYELHYRTSSGEFEIKSADVSAEIQSVTGTVAANALTAGLKAGILDFRSSSLTNGAPNTRVFGDLSLTVPSGATLGTINGIQSRLILIAIDNAGTVELAIVNQAGGNNLDETTLISTTTISGTSNSANVIYSTTGRSNVPFRVVGYIESTQATAGTWAASPTVLQGAGGNALTAMNSIGHGQILQDVTGSRAYSTTYYNTTGKPMWVEVIPVSNSTITYTASGQTRAYIGQVLTLIIQPGESYNVSATNPLSQWMELR